MILPSLTFKRTKVATITTYGSCCEPTDSIVDVHAIKKRSCKEEYVFHVRRRKLQI